MCRRFFSGSDSVAMAAGSMRSRTSARQPPGGRRRGGSTRPGPVPRVHLHGQDGRHDQRRQRRQRRRRRELRFRSAAHGSKGIVPVSDSSAWRSKLPSQVTVLLTHRAGSLCGRAARVAAWRSRRCRTSCSRHWVCMASKASRAASSVWSTRSNCPRSGRRFSRRWRTSRPRAKMPARSAGAGQAGRQVPAVFATAE